MQPTATEYLLLTLAAILATAIIGTAVRTGADRVFVRVTHTLNADEK